MDDLMSILPMLRGVDLVIRGHVGEAGRVARDCADTLGSAYEDLGTPVLYAGDRGRILGKVKLASVNDEESALLSNTVINLDRSVGEAPEIVSMLHEFEQELGVRRRELFLSESILRDETTRKIREIYLGSNICRRCHKGIVSRFTTSRHFRAFESLRVKGEGSNTECLACHSTGYGRFSGYDPESEKEGGVGLRGVQCEACHGPGTKHSRDGRYIETARKSCLACHTRGWSPDFDFETYWQRVGHCINVDTTKSFGTH
jgi:hypothetical protein